MEDAGLIEELQRAEEQRSKAAASACHCEMQHGTQKLPGCGLPALSDRRDPVQVIGCLAELWMGHSAYTLSNCSSVSRMWNEAVRIIRHMKQPVISISVLDQGLHALATTDRVVRRVLSASPSSLAEVHLHGLTRITDSSIRPLTERCHVRVVGLTHCTRLTAGARIHLPPSVRELRMAGCVNMYHQLEELAAAYTLDVHRCPAQLQLVDVHAASGFRFVDPALRAGIRLGPLHACDACRLPHAAGASHEHASCEQVPDLYGRTRAQPELWHASSFDWGFCAERHHHHAAEVHEHFHGPGSSMSPVRV